ncbi:uncharacterized protein LOC130692112 [Daphnia carinata]|uniref:uncharacterized protein LOC130692112 n=1 Tax=Daphnia carinata TaxID=120202 RepID=UPI00257B5652|nr:uncharacterized protein LOC130692112 [Daphnia carinata]XP_059351870.1 uncharacterized protein LOC130692112 [Daphnia carinata]
MSSYSNDESESRPELSPTSPGFGECGASECVKLGVSYNRLAAISSGTTSCLPLIELPKKKVDFSSAEAIIRPLSIHGEPWSNLSAELSRRQSTPPDVTVVGDVIVEPPAPVERRGRIVQIQRHFKKAFTRLRKVFTQPSGTTINKSEASAAVILPVRQRSLVRTDSSVTHAKRLAAKRKRPNVTNTELADTEWIRQFQLQKLSTECEPESNEITSELQEIFDQLTVSVNKRPRLDSTEPYVCRIRSC